MRSVKYLEMLKQQAEKTTNEDIGKMLGISTGAVSHYFTGRRVMDDETCLAVALKLNIDPIQVVGAACIDRAEKAGQPSLWTVFMERAAATAAIAVLATGVNLFLTPGEANAAQMRVEGGGDSAHYKLCEIGRRSRRAVFAWFKRLFVATALTPATS